MANDVQSLQTASKKIRYLGSAKSGVAAARQMHLTSFALVPLTVGFVWILLSLIGKDYAAVRAELGHFVPALVFLLFVGVNIHHMQLGMRTIIEDYVHTRHAKEWALMGNLFFSVLVGFACILATLKITFGA